MADRALAQELSKIPPLQSMTSDELRKRLTPLFSGEEIQLVALFGSVATGGTHRRSDIDLAVISGQPVDIVALTTQVMQLLRTDRVDVVDLRRASPVLAMAVAKTGTPLFERSPGIFNAFCSRAARMYADTRKLREARERGITSYLAERRAA